MKKIPMFLALMMTYSPFVIAESSDKRSPNDGEILQFVITANQIDIDNGDLAKKKASNKQVRAYANRMIKERTDLNKEAKALVINLKKPTQEDNMSKKMNDEGKKTYAQLKNLNGTDFDKAYIDAEIMRNEELIDVADNTLPTVKDDATKALLTKVRPALAAHLELAKTIQSSISKIR